MKKQRNAQTQKLRNEETTKRRNQEAKKPRNFETNKPRKHKTCFYFYEKNIDSLVIHNTYKIESNNSLIDPFLMVNGSWLKGGGGPGSPAGLP